MQNIKNSVIVKDNNCYNLIVLNNSSSQTELDNFEKALIKIYKSLELREQVKFMSNVFDLEAKIKSGKIII